MEEWEVWDVSDEETNIDSVKLSDENIDADNQRNQGTPSPSPNRCVSVRSPFRGDSSCELQKSCNLEDSLLEEVKTVYVFKGNNNNRSTESLTKSCDLSAPTKKQSFRKAFRNRLSINFEIPSLFSKSKSMENLQGKTKKSESHHAKPTTLISECDVFQASDEHANEKETKHSTSLPVPIRSNYRTRSLTDTPVSGNKEDAFISTLCSTESIVKPPAVKEDKVGKISPTTNETANNKDKEKNNSQLITKKSSDNTVRTADSGYSSHNDSQKQNLSYSITFTPEHTKLEETNKKHKQPTKTLTSLQAGLLPLIAVGLGEEKHNTDHVITSVTSPHTVEEYGSFHIGDRKGETTAEVQFEEYIEIDFEVPGMKRSPPSNDISRLAHADNMPSFEPKDRSCSTPLDRSLSFTESQALVTPIKSNLYGDSKTTETPDVKRGNQINNNVSSGGKDISHRDADSFTPAITGVHVDNEDTHNDNISKNENPKLEAQIIDDNDESSFKLMHAVYPDKANETHEHEPAGYSPTRKFSDDNPLSPLEDSIASFEAHEREFLSNADSNNELNTYEESPKMYRDTVDDDVTANRKMTMDLLSYMPTISETSTEVGSMCEKEVDATSAGEGEDDEKENEYEEKVRTLSSENLRLHDQEIDDEKSLKDEILEDYINIDFSEEDPTKEKVEKIIAVDLAAEPQNVLAEPRDLSLNGGLSQNEAKNDLNIPDTDELLDASNQNTRDVEEIRGALIITEVPTNHATVTEKKIINVDNNTKNHAELLDVSFAECIITTDQVHEAIIKTIADNTKHPAEIIDENGAEKGETTSISQKGVRVTKPVIHSPVNACQSNGKSVIDLTNEDDDYETNNDVQFISTNNQSVEYPPEQQTIENAIQINGLRKNKSSKHGPSLAMDNLHTSYDEHDDTYHCVDQVNNKQNKNVTIEDILKNKNASTDDENEQANTIQAKDYDDSGSDKPTEMYESVENESNSSEGDEEPSTQQESNTNDPQQVEDEEHLEDLPQSVSTILLSSDDNVKCSERLQAYVKQPETYCDFYLQLSDTAEQSTFQKKIDMARRLYEIIEDYELCNFMNIINDLLCHLGVLKSEKKSPLCTANVPKLLHFLKQMVEETNLKDHHIQTFAYFLAKPSPSISLYKSARLEFLEACFIKEMKLELKKTGIPTLDYVTTAFRKLCEYLVSLDADRTKDLTCRYIVPHITEDNSNEFVTNVVAYMGLKKTEVMPTTTENLKPAIVILGIVIDCSRHMSIRSQDTLDAFLTKKSQCSFFSKQKDILHRKLNRLQPV